MELDFSPQCYCGTTEEEWEAKEYLAEIFTVNLDPGFPSTPHFKAFVG